MAELRAASHAQIRTRRFRASATVAVTVAVERSSNASKPSRRTPASSNWVPRGLTDPGVRWDVPPERILPEAWTPAEGDTAVPGSLLAAEAHRSVDGG